MIEASQRMIRVNSQGEGINPATKRHLELEIKTLQNAPRRDVDKLQALLKVKERKTKGTGNVHGRHTKRLVTEEIEMLRVVFCI
jgi:hypothetical protein